MAVRYAWTLLINTKEKIMRRKEISTIFFIMILWNNLAGQQFNDISLDLIL